MQEFRLFINLHIMKRRHSISLQWRWSQEERRFSMKYVARCKDDEIPGALAMQYLVCSVFLSSMKAVSRGTKKQAWTNGKLQRTLRCSRNEILTRFLVEKWEYFWKYSSLNDLAFFDFIFYLVTSIDVIFVTYNDLKWRSVSRCINVGIKSKEF